MVSEPFTDSNLYIDEVKDRWDILETPVTGMPKKVRGAYVSWKDSFYNGALLTKSDLKKLKNWCEHQINHFDDDDKDEVKP